MKINSWEYCLLFYFQRDYGKGSISKEFATKLSSLLRMDFYSKTGLDVNKEKGKITLSNGSNFRMVYKENDNVSEISAAVMISHNSTGVVIKWKSKNGRIIKPQDVNIEENEMEAWFHDLNVSDILRNYDRIHVKSSETINQYQFLLEIDAYSWESVYIQIDLKTEFFDKKNAEIVNKQVIDFITFWNKVSEENNRQYGVVHDIKRISINDHFLEYHIDFGSAFYGVLEKLLNLLSETKLIAKVKITSYP